jgi:hypothetical protein
VFERQKCAPEYKSSKEHLTGVCCGNALRNHKLRLVVLGKAKKPQFFMVPKQAAFFSIITTRKEDGWIGRF